MNKLLITALFIGALTAGMLIINGCGKSDKMQTERDKRISEREALDTIGNSGVQTYYATSDGKYWQNYPGTETSSGAQMILVKDTAELNKIHKAMLGESNETVYTCEMHPQIHQNYSGKCPICKMELIKLEKRISLMPKTHEQMDSLWEGKPNIIHKELSVPQAKCAAYKKIIEEALAKDKGIVDNLVDTEEHTVHLYLDKTKTNIEEIKKLIQMSGFDVENLKADADAQKRLPDCSDK